MPVLILALLLFASHASHASAQRTPLELYTGASSLLVFGPLSGETSAAVEAALVGQVTDKVSWTGGFRMGVGPWSSEGYARLSAAPRFGAFMPSAGFELGWSARGDDDSGERLLGEGREVARDELVPLYLAVHTTPLRFALSEKLRLSLLELQIGTHVAPLGRFVRLHVGLVSLGVVL